MMAVFIFKLIRLPPLIPVVLKMLHKMIQDFYEQSNMLGNVNNNQIDFAHPHSLLNSFLTWTCLLFKGQLILCNQLKVLSSLLLYLHISHIPAIEYIKYTIQKDILDIKILQLLYFSFILKRTIRKYFFTFLSVITIVNFFLFLQIPGT